jgi:phosphoserine phosphatase
MKLALIFDFDETLVDESTSAYIESKGINVDEFWQKTVKKLIDEDWDPVPAYMFKMIEASINAPITKDDLISFAKQVTYKQGVESLFENLRSHIKDNHPKFEIEYYIISSGIGEIIRHTSIAKHFKDIWASDFAYDQKGEIIFPKKVLSFTDKTRYLFQISKGMVGEEFRSLPYVVNDKYDSNSYQIPFTNMIYIGDGLTDVPCFSLLKKQNGTAIAVYEAQNTQALGKAWRFIKEERVSNLHSANYEKGSDLYNSILMAIDSIASDAN